jgi:hypothetical protein
MNVFLFQYVATDLANRQIQPLALIGIKQVTVIQIYEFS